LESRQPLPASPQHAPFELRLPLPSGLAGQGGPKLCSLFGKHGGICEAPSVTAKGLARITRDHMQMKVENRLASLGTIELHQRDAISLEHVPHNMCDLLSGMHYGAGECRIKFKDILGRALRDDEGMTMGLWHHIQNRNGPLIFKEFVRCYLAAQDFREDVVLIVSHAIPPPADKVCSGAFPPAAD
jgi:hypothetical protein